MLPSPRDERDRPPSGVASWESDAFAIEVATVMAPLAFASYERRDEPSAWRRLLGYFW